jgi:SAM-dependent methyltransferase
VAARRPRIPVKLFCCWTSSTQGFLNVAETHFDDWIARRYARLWPELFEPAVLEPAVATLAELAGEGPALEFGIGTGRVAIPLARLGVRVGGIELSEAMVEELRRQGGADMEVVIGDFADVTLPGNFKVVYLLRNTITNLTTPDEQVQAFRNAAHHLEPGGVFVVENYIPQVRKLPPGETRVVFVATPDHIGVEDYDLVAQIAVSQHWWLIDGHLKAFSSRHRYVWPSELDLMARMAGMTLRNRWCDWQRSPFTSESDCHVSVWTKPR